MKKWATILPVLGVTISLWIFASEIASHSDSIEDIPYEALILFALVGPWILLLILNYKKNKYLGSISAAIPMLLIEFTAYYMVFINPSAGYAAILAYMIRPVLQLICILFGSLVNSMFTHNDTDTAQ